jgi:hypothetical protein
VKWFALVYAIVAGFITLLAIADLIGGVGWGILGTRCQSGVGMVAFGLFIYKIAAYSLSRN